MDLVLVIDDGDDNSGVTNGTILNDDNAAPGDSVAFDSASFSVDEGNNTADNVVTLWLTIQV